MVLTPVEGGIKVFRVSEFVNAPQFPVAEWEIAEEELNPEQMRARETIFALANGYLGIRGSLEEGRLVSRAGTFINGFYDTERIVYAEPAYGLARRRQRMLNVTDGTSIELYVGDDPLDLATGRVLSHRRVLDLRGGFLRRELEWESPSGVRIHLNTLRLVSFAQEHLALIDWRVTLLSDPIQLTVVSSLIGRSKPEVGYDDPRIGASLSKDALILRSRRIDAVYGSLRHITRNSRLSIVTMMANRLRTTCRYHCLPEESQRDVWHRYQISAGKGEEIRLTKLLSYYTTIKEDSRKLLPSARRSVDHAWDVGVESIAEEQERWLSDYWERSDVIIEGEPEIQQGVRFNLFHLVQAAGRNGESSVAAKGLTGEGYEGHYFWDAEIYSIPYFTYTSPDIARKLLEYRYHTLPQARRRAKELHMQGALYPWRTINGEEASAYFPAGTAQYHINADIMFALRTYVDATKDREFLYRYGAEMYIETARFWLDLGDYVEGRGFCINEVTGPDEYTAMVNNNTYTNLMARDNLATAAAIVERLAEEDPETMTRLRRELELADVETGAWRSAAEAMFIPRDQEKGIYAQDDTFLTKAPWDFEGTPKERYPLLLHYHPLTIYRYQVLKQPDVVLALFLQGFHFSPEEKKRNFDFYDPLTTGDSSLSPCIQSIVAAEVGYTDLAYRYFKMTANMDLEDVNGNVDHGAHIANMAGTWLALVYGFAGMRDYAGELSFAPRLPRAWDRLAFTLQVAGNALRVDIAQEKVVYAAEGASGLVIRHHGKKLSLKSGVPESVPILSE
ncbi:MAG: glycoside hydrolase family 65 protein [Spirochaetota bacterium]